jgi:hypothetical protein
MSNTTATETHWLLHFYSECKLRKATQAEIAEAYPADGPAQGGILAIVNGEEHRCLVVPSSLTHLYS